MRAAVLAVMAACAAWAEEAPAGKCPSPDARFELRASGNIGVVQIVEAAADRVVLDLTESATFPDEVALVWAPDSRTVAVNYRAGGRYETTGFFRWDGRTFVPLESPEGRLHEQFVEPARKRELTAAGRPVDTSLHRVWDAWKTVKWIDAHTAALHGESTAFYETSDADPVDIATAVDAKVTFDAKGKPEILEAAEVPASD